MSSEHQPREHVDASSDTLAPARFIHALAAFARHDAAVHRHLDLLERLNAAKREQAALRDSMERLTEHSARAVVEMRSLREAVAAFTRELRDGGAPPERALILVRGLVESTVKEMPLLDRPHDSVALAADLVQSSIEAYFAA
ncbi:MAG: hypothetical protein ACREPM_25695 [Gemmatimonadaceae bacterium]